jgi:hypothetical protein
MAAAGFVAGVALTALALWWLVPGWADRRASAPPTPGPARAAGAPAGAMTPTSRAEVRLGDAATAVVEPGAELRWATRAGRVEIDQARGRVFYRADRPLVVRTRWGELEVLGTSFSVDASRARTELVVYEGAVAVAAPGGASDTTVGAGRRVALTRRGVGAEQAAPWLEDAPAPAAPGSATAALQAAAGACDGAGVENVFTPDASTLAAWAEACRLHFDVAPMGYDPGMLEHYLDELGVTTEERPVVREVIAAVEARANQELARLYADATGDDTPAERMSLDWMFAEVLRSADTDEPAQVRRTLARERAGLAPAPADLRRVTPYEELVRSLMRSGDDLERALAARLGAGRARELRARHGGWPGLRWNVAGCPPAGAGTDAAE